MPMDRLRRELAESRMRFEALAENIPQLAWMADGTGSIFWYNRRWYDFTGTTLEEMRGWGWRSVHDPELVEGIIERFKTSIAAGEQWEDTFPLRSAQGDYRWFLSRALPVRDETGEVVLWCGTNTDITDRRENAERILMLMQEVNHRARNMLSMVQTIVNRSAGADSDLARAVNGRIQALAANHDLLNDQDWVGVDLGTIIERHVSHADDKASNNIVLKGPRGWMLKPSVAEAIGLAMHELATNALKYGALSDPKGHVSVTWDTVERDNKRLISIEWIETGGPEPVEPSKVGFGTMIINRYPQMASGGKVDIEYAPQGLRWSLLAPWDVVMI